jgi:hypothetical protein
MFCVPFLSDWLQRRAMREIPTAITSEGQRPISVTSDHFGECLFNATAAIAKRFSARLPRNHINRTSLHKHLDTAFESSVEHTKQFVVALGAKGVGKSTAIGEWLDGKRCVVQASADRSHSAEMIYGRIAEGLNCRHPAEGPALLRSVVKLCDGRLIVHVDIAAGEKHQQLASINLINMARRWSTAEHSAFFILDASPHAIDPERVRAERGRIYVLQVDDFTQSEGETYVRENLGPVHETMRDAVFHLVGLRPLMLFDLIRLGRFSINGADAAVADELLTHQRSFDEHPQCVMSMIRQGAASSADCVISADTVYDFRWIRYSLVNGSIRFHFHSTAVLRAAEKWAIGYTPPRAPAPAAVWVTVRASNSPPFSVAPTANDVDHLKKAIKAEKTPRLDHIAADLT